MTNCMNVMAELAHPDRGYPLQKWLAYEARLRILAARKPKDLSFWSTAHSETKQHTCLTNSHGSTTSRDHAHNVQLRVTESFNQPFGTFSAKDREFCQRFSRGQCNDKPCPNGFVHACNICPV
ncbi:hypothetical protein RvY_10870 [Ramazzottius varieornatus]|uniref:Uncharacterized protein n=1 Tax=Ramazzottius varieornatus TaxID=947166 RepID=A0A1D1VE67_RAMVA|nr:hypothetical protein RvY_10870 [Ramazzottius varieornatus]